MRATLPRADRCAAKSDEIQFIIRWLSDIAVSLTLPGPTTIVRAAFEGGGVGFRELPRAHRAMKRATGPTASSRTCRSRPRTQSFPNGSRDLDRRLDESRAARGRCGRTGASRTASGLRPWRCGSARISSPASWSAPRSGGGSIAVRHVALGVDRVSAVRLRRRHAERVALGGLGEAGTGRDRRSARRKRVKRGNELAYDPIHQFHIEKIIPIEIGGLDLSFTNSALFMVLTVAGASAFLLLVDAQPQRRSRPLAVGRRADLRVRREDAARIRRQRGDALLPLRLQPLHVHPGREPVGHVPLFLHGHLAHHHHRDDGDRRSS